MIEKYTGKGFEAFVAVVGALVILAYVVRLLMFICRNCRCEQNLMAMYGERQETYAVVTGGSDGIGLALCDELARRGFNICMISRNKAKIDDKLNILRGKYPTIKMIGV